MPLAMGAVTLEEYRTRVREFISTHVVPYRHAWDDAGIVPRHVFERAAEYGLTVPQMPPDAGGAGLDDYRYSQALLEEAAAAGVTTAVIGITVHNDVCGSYLLPLCTEAQRERWFPGILDGSLIAAIALTEPHAGSDLAAVRTTATPCGDDGYRVRGDKSFVTNGINADLVVTAARLPDARRGELTLIVAERDTPGFDRGRNVAKLGMHAQDTAELRFRDAFVPRDNRLGEEGRGFGAVLASLTRERLSIAVGAVAAARAAITATISHVSAHGAEVPQATRFALAERATELRIGSTFLDEAIERFNAGTLTPEDAAMAKWWCSEFQGKTLDVCLQLHGDVGHPRDSLVARTYLDARVTRIYGGTTEIMKEVIGRSLGL